MVGTEHRYPHDRPFMNIIFHGSFMILIWGRARTQHHHAAALPGELLLQLVELLVGHHGLLVVVVRLRRVATSASQPRRLIHRRHGLHDRQLHDGWPETSLSSMKVHQRQTIPHDKRRFRLALFSLLACLALTSALAMFMQHGRYLQGFEEVIFELAQALLVLLLVDSAVLADLRVQNLLLSALCQTFPSALRA